MMVVRRRVVETRAGVEMEAREVGDWKGKGDRYMADE